MRKHLMFENIRWFCECAREQADFGDFRNAWGHLQFVDEDLSSLKQFGWSRHEICIEADRDYHETKLYVKEKRRKFKEDRTPVGGYVFHAI
ncbi:MAG: hypothetical protein ABIH92_02210 [Nanoarchaeota archaeon]